MIYRGLRLGIRRSQVPGCLGEPRNEAVLDVTGELIEDTDTTLRQLMAQQ